MSLPGADSTPVEVMHVQRENVVQADPLASLEEDYRDAVIHLAWDRCSASNTRTLLFAFVELLPHEIPAPVDNYDAKSPGCSHRLGSDSKHYVYLRRAVMPAKRALGWYLACRRGHAEIPPLGADGPKKLQVASLSEEPVWPTLISNGDGEVEDQLPFCPTWIECPRTHHLVPESHFNLTDIWSEAEEERARTWLRDRLHFDLSAYPEYWGSVHLVAPNPLFRGIHIRLLPGTPPVESVIARLEPRAQRSLAGLEMIFHEKAPWGVTATRRSIVESNCIVFDLGRQVDAIAIDVLEPSRGYLHLATQPVGFIQSIGFGFHLATRTVVDTDVDGGAYEVNRSGKPEMSTVGEPAPVSSARQRLHSAHYSRRSRARGAQARQLWFRGQQEEARDVLRSLIHPASTQVMVIDPYLGAEEVAKFALAVGRHDIPVRLLSSAAVLRKPHEEDGSREKGEVLASALEQLAAYKRMNPFEVRVMTGARPDIHDRFLVVDDAIWLLGSSLNEFGARGTMIVGLPDPESVRGHLLHAWNAATSLKKWLEERLARRGGKGAG